MANNEKSGNTLIHDTICLFIITLVSGVLLGAVYMITKQPIADAEEKAKKEAYAAVYPDAGFSSDDEIDKKLEAFQADLAAGTTKTESGGDLSDVVISEVMVADKGGYVVTVSGKGYGGAVKMALAIDGDGKIIGIQITDCTNETPGLGQNSSNEEWNSQYKDKTTADEVKVDKDGGDISAISGATITSRAVTRAVNGALLFIASLG